MIGPQAVGPAARPGAVERRGFHFDAASCSGCKACQVACRDRNALPPGVQWRRIYEITGGSWRQQGKAWVNDVFAYTLSIGCNHCEHPICVEVCPSGAMRQRADGVVLVDQDRCVGCGYCAWACPYDAPQLDPTRGTMGKCTYCIEDVEVGREPACVAACPLRSLTRESFTAGDDRSDVVPPLPSPALTHPALRVRPHASTSVARTSASTRVANREELPARTPAREWSLVTFTLLAQTAAGLVWVAGAQRLLRPGFVPAATHASLRLAALLLVAGLAASLLHLGRPLRAWRALANLRTSWLSRELLLTGAFGLGLAALVLLPRPRGSLLHAFTAVAGLAMVFAMAKVYRLRTVPSWDRVRTPVTFFAAAAALGVAAWLAIILVSTGSTVASIAALTLFIALTITAVESRSGFYRSHGRPSGTPG